MDISSTITIILFLLQTSIGAPTNIFILMAYAHINHTEKDLKPTDIILCHLVFANMLGLVTRGLPQIMSDLGLNNIHNDASCKLLIHAYRTSRGVSICVMSFLSVYQAITLAPSTTQWLFLKSRTKKYSIPYIICFWLFNMLLNAHTLSLMYAQRNGTIPGAQYNLGSCYSKTSVPSLGLFFKIIVNGHDVFFVGLMLICSVYILYVLKRHRDQVQYIQSTRQNSKVMAERTAAKNVITLVSLYVFCFGVDTGFLVYSGTLLIVPPLLYQIRVFISSCYALLSPFVIISFNKKIYRRLRCSHKEGTMKHINTN
ncbi:olfactory receptor class A-like protein 1 [Microcaecilia unicolor]|uniref:Vomeronasal type-1 receptor n=1 Tax=Microcaecilia unicolor TaxID=1415580 RepID=A0A6P7ZDQ1_9AMPH|nr:olfactory receptor class A-like protein 1 [Microcaecilia unicolor]